MPGFVTCGPNEALVISGKYMNLFIETLDLFFNLF